MSEPIHEAKQVKVEQPVVPPCDLVWGAELTDGLWHPCCEEYIRDQMKMFPHGQYRLFHLSDAPSAPLAVDAGEREGLAKAIALESEKSVQRGLENGTGGDGYKSIADVAIEYMKSLGWGPKGEEWNAVLEKAVERIAKEADSLETQKPNASMDLNQKLCAIQDGLHRAMNAVRSLKHGGA